MRAKRLGRFSRGFFRAVDQANLSSHDFTDCALDERIMRATEHERVDRCADERPQVLRCDQSCYFRFEPSFLDERNEQWTRSRHYIGSRQLCDNRTFVRM